MSTCVNRGIRLSSLALRMEEEAKASEQQGIGTILGSDPERPKSASLRRTLSADMSSKKWLAPHPMRKIASSEGFPVISVTDSSYSSSSTSEGEEEEEESRSEQQKKELERPGMTDIWSSILSQKADVSSKFSSASAPYIHPLVKKSKSSLTEKSLEICTESLGSETGSDSLSSYPPSETSSFEEDAEETEEEQGAINYNCSGSGKSTPRPFPPPLPSLSRRDGPGLHMRSHRRDGRLVLEAVPVPSYNYFHADRQGGRLLLSFINTTPIEEPAHMEETDEEVEEEEELSEVEKEDEAEEFEELEEEEIEKGEKENGVEGRGIVEEVKIWQPCEMINVHRSALVMNKHKSRTNKDPTWSLKSKQIVDTSPPPAEEEEGLVPTPLPQSLPSRPPMARLISSSSAASFNAYEYGWRTTPVVATAAVHPLAQPPLPINNDTFLISRSPRSQEQPLRGNRADCVVPLLRSCKDPRRSLVIWETRCIATS